MSSSSNSSIIIDLTGEEEPEKKKRKSCNNGFKGANIFICAKGFTRKQLEVFQEKVSLFGGIIAHTVDRKVTHIVSKLSFEDTEKWLKDEGKMRSSHNATVHNDTWLMHSLARKNILSHKEFLVEKSKPEPPKLEERSESNIPTLQLAPTEPLNLGDSSNSFFGVNLLRSPPPCLCGLTSNVQKVRSEASRNFERPFFCCAKSSVCKFFEWADEPPQVMIEMFPCLLILIFFLS